MGKKLDNNAVLDPEWVQLLLEAKRLGFTIEEIKIFFKSKGILF